MAAAQPLLAVVPNSPVLSSVRAQLSYLLDKQTEATAKRAGAAAAAARLEHAQQTEATAKGALADLDALEAGAMVTWAENGGDMPQLDAERRQQLMGDLAKATATANAARLAGEQILAEAQGAQGELNDIAGEVQSAIHGVLIAELDPVFAELTEVETRRRSLVGKAIALGTLLKDGADRFEVSDPRRIPILSRAVDIQTRLKPFTSDQIPISNGEVDQHKPAFIALASKLGTDATASLE